MVREFAKAVIRHWKREVIGGVLIGALALASELTGISIPPRVYEVAAALLVFYAMFLAWTEERHALEGAIAKLTASQTDLAAERQARKPDLACQVERCCQLEFQMGQNEGFGSNILVEMIVRNSGARTALTDWRLDIPSVTTQSVKPRSDPWSDMLFKQNKLADLLHNSRRPIERGDILAGVLIFTVPNLTTSMREAISRVLITFTDALGETHLAEWPKSPDIGSHV